MIWTALRCVRACSTEGQFEPGEFAVITGRRLRQEQKAAVRWCWNPSKRCAICMMAGSEDELRSRTPALGRPGRGPAPRCCRGARRSGRCSSRGLHRLPKPAPAAASAQRGNWRELLRIRWFPADVRFNSHRNAIALIEASLKLLQRKGSSLRRAGRWPC